MIEKNYKNRLYGRTRGRSNQKINIQNYFKIIEKFKINKFNKKNSYILDIGSGYGETSIYLAKQYTSHTIVSCEKYINGNINLIKKIENEKITNLKIHNGNVYDILEKLNDKYFSFIWIFFPDPWPKKKHFKRRLINLKFFQKIYNLLKNNGEIFIITDSISYSYSIFNTIYTIRKLFNWKNQHAAHLRLKDYYDLETKYYKKAINSNKNPSIFILEKL